MRTFGEFFDAVEHWAKENANEGELHLDSWAALASPEKWQVARATELSDNHFRCFAEDMAFYFVERIQGICTDELYQDVIQQGHEFLKAIAEIGQQFGLHVTVGEVDIPLSPSDAYARAGRIPPTYGL